MNVSLCSKDLILFMMCLLTRHKGNCINPLIFIIRDIKGEEGRREEGEEGEEGGLRGGWV